MKLRTAKFNSFITSSDSGPSIFLSAVIYHISIWQYEISRGGEALLYAGCTVISLSQAVEMVNITNVLKNVCWLVQSEDHLSSLSWGKNILFLTIPGAHTTSSPVNIGGSIFHQNKLNGKLN
jgi:hypothetical protein